MIPRDVSDKLIGDVRAHLMNHAVGRAAAVTIDSLALQFSCSRREIEMVGEAIRDSGLPLASAVSKPFGWFIARDRIEFDEYDRQISHRIEKMSRRRALAREWLDRHCDKEPIQLALGI